MSALRWDSRPSLRAPILIAAFAGWTDANSAGSDAADYLARKWGAAEFAEIDAEEFYDFTVQRPRAHLDASGAREVLWPRNRFLAAATQGPHDVVLLIGIEPHLRWRTFCSHVAAVAAETGVKAAFILGAVPAEIAHTRPTPVRGSSADAGLAGRLGLLPPRYVGPTGIVGVLLGALATAAIPAGSLMAQVPYYVTQTPAPKAVRSLVERVCELLMTTVNTSDLQVQIAEYERQVSEAVAADYETSAYVGELERRAGRTDPIGELPSGEELAARLEQFLRDQDDS
jgi:predicted ATP-grasp superfamily ATP-dependent carboligase